MGNSTTVIKNSGSRELETINSRENSGNSMDSGDLRNSGDSENPGDPLSLLTPRKNYGWIRDLPDSRDIYMEWPDIASYAYAYEKIDLRESGFLPSVYNQGKLGSCTANAIAAAFSYVHSKDCDKKKDLNSLSPNDSCQVFEPSRLFIYYNERLMENTVMVDSGASIRDGIKSISKVGVCPESDYPYIIDRFRDHPGKKAYADASKHKSIEYRCINIDLGEVRKAISVDLPIVFGFSVYKSFEKIGSDGVMPLPEENEKLLGGHAVLIVGYDNEKEHLIVLNSWGSSWGDNGYFYMPYDFFTPLTCADAWIVSRIEETI